MTKIEYQKQNDEMRQDLAAYRELGTPEQINKGLDKAVQSEAIHREQARIATTTLEMIKKLLA